MDTVKAKILLAILSKQWKIENKQLDINMFDYLEKSVEKKICFSHGFEFSLIEDEKDIRFLHYYFWKSQSQNFSINNYLKKRKASLKTLFKRINSEKNCSLNITSLTKLFEFQSKCCWPIQFGLSYSRNDRFILKVYLSIREKSYFSNGYFPLEEFCIIFHLSFEKLKKVIESKKYIYDSVGIDFFPNGDNVFKFYTFNEINQSGQLFRFSHLSKLKSHKKWFYCKNGILFADTEPVFMMKSELNNFIVTNNLKIHYFCQEKGRKSIYLR